MANQRSFIPADSTTLLEFLRERRLRALTYPSPTTTDLKSRLDTLTPDQLLVPAKVVSATDALCIKGALYERHDFYDAAHTCAQEAGESPTVAYWHGICHRRQPDYGNSKHWFRRVGRHPIFPQVCRAVCNFLVTASDDVAATFRRHLEEKGEWDAFYWIDLCSEWARQEDEANKRVLMEVQEIEWEVLFEYTYRAATASE